MTLRPKRIVYSHYMMIENGKLIKSPHESDLGGWHAMVAKLVNWSALGPLLFLPFSSVRPRVGEDQFHKSNFWFCEQIPRVWWLINWNFIITFTWYYFISLKVLTSIFKPVDEILGCDLRSNQTSSIFISHRTTVSIKLMKALTFEHVDGIQGFAGPFKRILFLPVMLSRFKKRNLFTSIEFT